MAFKLSKIFKRGSVPAAASVQVPRCEQLEDRLLLSLLDIVVEITPPVLNYDATAQLAYNAENQTFDVTGSDPIWVFIEGGFVNIDEPSDLEVHIKVDSAGNLIGGVAGDDLSITGSFELNGTIYTNELMLTAEVVEFGFLDSGITDFFDFRFTPTGGALSYAFEGKDIGMYMTSISSTFNDTSQGFQVDFIGSPEGVLGAVEPSPFPVISGPSSLSGFVYEDTDNDGGIGANEFAIAGVTVTLTDGDNNLVDTVQTDADGHYMFIGLDDDYYTITETQPAGYEDGIDTAGIGSVGGTVGNDVFSTIALDSGVDAENYNFGEQKANSLAESQTATIGFWQNKNGQELLKGLNGSETSTALADWLILTFPNIYGAGSVRTDLTATDRTNTSVAELYRATFRAKAKQLRQLGITNAPKLEVQVMATAFAAYVTSSNLAGDDGAAAYGFLVTLNGAGAALFDLGSYGSLFDVADGTEMSILEILLSTDSLALEYGDLVNLDSILRAMINEIYTAINEGGDIA